MKPNKPTIGGIMRNQHIARISVLSVPDRPGVAAELLDALGRQDLNIHFIAQCIDPDSRDHIVLCVNRDELDACRGAIEPLLPSLQAECFVCDPDAASISIFGPDFRERPGVAATMFRALAEKSINILAISTSISTVTCIVAASHLAAAEEAIRGAFTLP